MLAQANKIAATQKAFTTHSASQFSDGLPAADRPAILIGFPIECTAGAFVDSHKEGSATTSQSIIHGLPVHCDDAFLRATTVGEKLQKFFFVRASMYHSLLRIKKSSRQSASQTVKTIAVIFVLAVATCGLPPVAQAQFRASIQGTVSDPSGAVIPGATVTLTDLGTSKVFTTTSDGNGLYNFNALPPDQFSLVVNKSGFRQKALDHLQLIPEQANAVNVQLELGDATQTVTVSGDEQPALDTETASISGVVSSNEIQHMPSFGRDVFQLSQLAPGSFGDGSQAAGAAPTAYRARRLAGAVRPMGSSRRRTVHRSSLTADRTTLTASLLMASALPVRCGVGPRSLRLVKTLSVM